MEIRNSLFWQKSLSAILLLALLNAGCETFTKPQPSGQPIEAQEQPAGQQTSEPVFARPKAKEDSFVRYRAPKLGLILGGGGILTYAQIGVLHELAQQKIPVQAVVGIEWGALIGSIYSRNKRPHEAEWQMLKLPFKKFDNKGVFSSKSDPVSPAVFSSYLRTIFKSSRLNQAKVPFACPIVNLKKSKAQLMKSGSYHDVLQMCWPYPPLFKIQNRVANPLAIREAVSFLKGKGAELILYVDVIDKNVLLTSSQRKNYPSANLLWSHARSNSAVLNAAGVHEVLSIPLSGTNMLAFDSTRLIVRMGQMKSRSQLKKFAKRYGY